MVIADLLLAQLTPLAIETSLQIHEELHAQVQEASRLRAQQVERARYAAELAQRRFYRLNLRIALARVCWELVGTPGFGDLERSLRKPKRNRKQDNVGWQRLRIRQ